MAQTASGFPSLKENKGVLFSLLSILAPMKKNAGNGHGRNKGLSFRPGKARVGVRVFTEYIINKIKRVGIPMFEKKGMFFARPMYQPIWPVI